MIERQTERQDDPSAEDSLIARYFRPIATDPGAFDLGDDAAILQARGDDIVVTTDAIVEGVHFLPDDPPDTIARKALRVNLSDLAAKGASPAGFVLTLALRAADDSLAGSVRARAWRGRRIVRLPAAGRRYGVDAGAADDLGHGVRPGLCGQDGPPQRRETRRPRRGDGDDRRCRARPRYPEGRRGRCRARRGCRGKADAGRTLPDAAAAQRAGDGGARSCSCGDGRVRWSCRRSRQAVQRPPACLPRSTRKVFRCPRLPRHCGRAAPSASRRSSPAATITRFYARSPRIALTRSRKPPGSPGWP